MKHIISTVNGRCFSLFATLSNWLICVLGPCFTPDQVWCSKSSGSAALRAGQLRRVHSTCNLNTLLPHPPQQLDIKQFVFLSLSCYKQLISWTLIRQPGTSLRHPAIKQPCKGCNGASATEPFNFQASGCFSIENKSVVNQIHPIAMHCDLSRPTQPRIWRLD